MVEEEEEEDEARGGVYVLQDSLLFQSKCCIALICPLINCSWLSEHKHRRISLLTPPPPKHLFLKEEEEEGRETVQEVSSFPHRLNGHRKARVHTRTRRRHERDDALLID